MTIKKHIGDGQYEIHEVKTWQFVSAVLSVIIGSWTIIAAPAVLWVRSISRDEATKVVAVEHAWNAEAHSQIAEKALANDNSMRLERMSQIDGIKQQLAEINENVKLLLARAVK